MSEPAVFVPAPRQVSSLRETSLSNKACSSAEPGAVAIRERAPARFARTKQRPNALSSVKACMFGDSVAVECPDLPVIFWASAPPARAAHAARVRKANRAGREDLIQLLP